MMSPRLQSPVFTSKFIHAAVFWGLRFLTGCWQDSSVPCHVGYGCSQYGSWFLPNWVIQKKENNRDRSCSVSYNIISEVTCHLCCQSFIDDPLYNVEGDSTRMWSLGPSWKLVSRWEHTTHRWRNTKSPINLWKDAHCDWYPGKYKLKYRGTISYPRVWQLFVWQYQMLVRMWEKGTHAVLLGRNDGTNW